MSPLHLPPLPTIGDLLRLYNLRAMKALSQNFLIDSKLRSKVVAASKLIKGSHVIEVGPGPGGLTRCIIEQGAKRIDVIEKDKRFIPILEHLREAAIHKTPTNIHLGDILKFNMAPIFNPEDAVSWEGDTPKMHIIGNLPFNVSTPLIIKWLKSISEHSNAWVHGRVPMTLTFQEEVGQRMIARADNIQRSRLSIMCQNWCHVHLKFIIPGKAFVPKPDVNVAVITFIPKIKPSIDLNFELVERVVLAIFSMRQKYCIRGAATLFPIGVRAELVEKMFTVADVDHQKKSLQLMFMEFRRLMHAYKDILKDHPELEKYNYRNSKENRMKKFHSDSDLSILDSIKLPNTQLENEQNL